MFFKIEDMVSPWSNNQHNCSKAHIEESFVNLMSVDFGAKYMSRLQNIAQLILEIGHCFENLPLFKIKIKLF